MTNIQMKNKPLVSIWMIAFNHEKYISEAIEGVLMQKTSFPIELIIGEDFSTDNTVSIIKKYVHKYPDLIKARYNEFNMGMIPNTIKTLQECNGKYIALCEGDDFWTDPYKLQKQIEILENNSELSGCAHQTTVIYDYLKNKPHDFRSNVPSLLTINQLLNDRKFHTASFVFRSKIISNHPLPENITAGDRALFLLVASFGNIKFINEPMACYRKNAGGISNWVTAELMEKDIYIAHWLHKINNKFPKYQYLSFIHYTIIAYPEKISILKLTKNYILYLIYSFSIFPNNLKPIKQFTFSNLPKIIKKNCSFFRSINNTIS